MDAASDGPDVADPTEPAGGGEQPGVEPARSQPAFRVRPVIRPRPERDGARSVSRDETDEGWGDSPSERGDDWYRRERPPHHGD